MFEVTTDLGEKILIPYSEAESRMEHQHEEPEEEEYTEQRSISKIASIIGIAIITMFFLYKVFSEEPQKEVVQTKENPIITLEREKEKELDIQKTCVDINAQSRERVRNIEREQTRQRLKNLSGLTMTGEIK